MATIFLINDNKIVSRLLQLSSEKHGYYLEEKNSPEASRDHYDIVLVDSDKYTPELIEEIKNSINFSKLGYIGVKKEEVPPEFDLHLDKPFLPSDFVTLIEENVQENAPTAEEMPEEQTALSEEIDFEEESLSLEVEEPAAKSPEAEEETEASVDDLLAENEITDEEIEALDELDTLDDLELDLDDLETEESTAHEEPLPEPEAATEGLKDLDKTEDALKELDALDEELDNVDLSLDSSAVMSTGVAEQFIEETLPESEPTPLHEIEANAMQTTEETPEEKESSIDTAAVAASLAAGAAAATAAVSAQEETPEEETPAEEQSLSGLDNLEGGEDIEHESDYIEEELTVESLAQEFDTLNETEVLKALNPDAELPQNEENTATPQAAAELPAEEILHEEIVTEGQETMVESNDVEQWIRDAVAKAITPDMIKEALQDMEVTIKLDFKKKDV